MKFKFLYAFLFFSISLFAQESTDKIIYLDSLLNFSTQSNYSYKWILKDYNNGEDLHEAVEYYKSGQIKTKGVTFSKSYYSTPFRFIDRVPLRDIILEYYGNGNKKSIINSSDPDLEKSYTWYANGQKKSESELLTKKERYESNSGSNWEIGNRPILNLRLLQFWNENGTQVVIDGNGEVELDNEYESAKGKYVNGKKNGEWIGSVKHHNFTYIENYSDGKLISGTSIDSLKNEHKYTVISKDTKPKKGFDSFINGLSILRHNKNTFEYSFEKNFSFSINTDGELIELNTRNILNEKDKEKVINFLSKYQNWKPAELKGIKIKKTLHYNFS